MSNHEINFERPDNVYTDTSNVFYRLRLMVATAIVINESKIADFENDFLRSDGLLYQLEAIHEIVKQYEAVFSSAAADCLKDARNLNAETVEA